MNRLSLFRKPKITISESLSGEPDWPLALAGYTMLAFSSGFERTHARMTDQPPLVSVLVMLVISAFVSWLWAWGWGGLYHLGARLLGGKPGVRDTVLAVGYSLVFPGVALAVGNVAVVLGAEDSAMVVGAGCGFFLVGFSWFAYNIVLAIRVRHGLSWVRSIAAWLLTTILYGGLIYGLAALVIHGFS